MLAVGERAVPAVHPRHDLIAQVGVVPAGAGRVDVLAAAVPGPGVDVDHERGRRRPAREHLISGLDERLPERAAVSPHIDITAISHYDVNDRVTAIAVLLVVVARRQVDQNRPFERIAQRIAPQQLARNYLLVDPSGELPRPRQHVFSVHETVDLTLRSNPASLCNRRRAV